MKRYYLITDKATSEYKRIFVEENGKCIDVYISDLNDNNTYRSISKTRYSTRKKSEMSINYYNSCYWYVKEITENEAFVELL